MNGAIAGLHQMCRRAAGVSAAVLVLMSVSAVGATEMASGMTPQEQANVKLVLDWWRVLQSGHAELVPKYIAPDVVQHNPNVAQGDAAIEQLLRGRTPVNPLPETLRPEQMPAVAMAQGDLVTLIWERDGKDPGDPTKTYRYNAFDMFRIKNGRIVEHWDAALKNPPPAR